MKKNIVLLISTILLLSCAISTEDGRYICTATPDYGYQCVDSWLVTPIDDHGKLNTESGTLPEAEKIEVGEVWGVPYQYRELCEREKDKEICKEEK
jgi:hypothetical protein